VKAGRLRALGVTSAQRLSALPDVPTIEEAGLPSYVYTTWYGIWGPAKTPTAVVNRLNQAIQKIVGQPDVRTSLQNAGIEPESTTPAQFADLVRNDLAKWSRIIREAGIKAQ
jgi:tripartite-type tricarboxylate transporter receptor subunit TctC